MKYNFPILLLILVSCTGNHNKESSFDITERETHWVFDIDFQEKFEEAEDNILPGDSLSELPPHRAVKGIEGTAYHGTGYLTQVGNQLQGFVLYEEDTLKSTGRVIETNEGNRYITLDFENIDRKKIPYGNINGLIENNSLSGNLMKVSNDSGNLIFGDIGFSNIFKQEVPPPLVNQQQQEDPCGNKIGERIQVLRSPTTGNITRMKIEWYERCVKATFVDENEQQLAGTEIFKMSQDIKEIMGNDTVLVYDAVLNGKKTTTKPDGNDEDNDPDDVVMQGEIKYISVRGCTNIKYYPYFEEYLRFKFANGPLGAPTVIQGFKKDGPQPNRGGVSMPNTGEARPLVDIPAYPVEELPFPEADLNNTADFAQYHHYHRYYTYICCDNELLGFTRWGYKVIYTIMDNSVQSRLVKKIKPKWFGPDVDTPAEDEVKNQCQGN